MLALARLMCLSTTCVLELSRSAEHVWDWVAYRRNTPSGSTPSNTNVICIKKTGAASRVARGITTLVAAKCTGNKRSTTDGGTTISAPETIGTAERENDRTNLLVTTTTARGVDSTAVGWNRHNGKGHNDRRSQGSRMGDRNQRDGKGQGRPNDYARGEQPSGNHCTWDDCRGKPSHTIIDCPERARRPCTRRQCLGQLHFRNQCPNGDGGQRSSGERMNARPQVNLLTRNQQLAQQLELNFQQGQSNQDPQVDFAISNRR